MTDVVLVLMPQAGVERPSIALGEIKACLTRSGIGSRVVHANLQYLEFVGPALIAAFERGRAEDGLVDWIFARAAFPEMASDEDAYLEALLARSPRLAKSMPDIGERLREARHRACHFIDWIADGVLADSPRIVGCSSTFQQHVASLALLRRIRERAPEVVTMMGGANCETRMGRATHRHFPWVDVVVSGEADGFIGLLCETILDNGAAVAADELPLGVFGPVHRQRGYPETAGGDGLPRATTEDISTVPLPDYDDYFEQLAGNLFAGSVRPGLPVESARGCWWGMRSHCTFCGLNGGGMAFRAKPAAQMLREMDDLAARYGVTGFEAVDNILPVDYFAGFLPALRDNGRAYDVFYETKANLKPHEVRALADAGVRWIQPGIENLDSRVLKLMRKGVGAWNNVRLLRLGRQHGMRLSWTILCDFPGEEDSWYLEMAAWLPWLSHLQPGGFTRLRFDRYSPYFDHADAYGLKLLPARLYRHIYPLDEAELAELAYYFEAEEADGSRRSLLSDLAVHRPGLEAVRGAVLAWVDAWQREPTPRLEMTDDGDAVVVEDTRPVAIAPTLRLEGAAAAALRTSLDAPPVAALHRALAEAGHDADAIDAAVRTLIDHRLALPLDGRLVGLALETPVTPLPDAGSFPGGRFQPPMPVRPAA